MQACLSPAWIESILTTVRRVREGLSLTVKQFQILWVWCQLCPTWYILACCTWDPYSGGSRPRGSPRGETRFARSRSRGDAYVPWTCGGNLGSCLRARFWELLVAASDGRIPDRLGSGHEWPPCPLSVEWTLSPGPTKSPCVGMHRPMVVSYINHQGGLCSCPLYKLAHQILGWSQEKFLSLRAVYISGYLNIGADNLPRQGPRPGEWSLHTDVVEQILIVFDQAQVNLFATRQTLHCPLWFSLTHPAPLGLDAMVQTWPRLRLYAFPPITLLQGVLERVLAGLSTPLWPGRV